MADDQGVNMRKLISADAHWGPPVRLSDELPARYRSEVPHLEERSDGLWFVRPRHGITDEFNWKERKIVNPGDGDMFTMGSYPHAAPSPYPEQRLAEMAKEGVVGEVLIGPGGFGLEVSEEIEMAWCTLLNDWLIEHYRDYMRQFAPGIHLPFACGMQAAVKELDRVARLGLRPVLLPDYFPGKPYYLPEWEPLWEACNAMKMPVTVHITPNRGREVGAARAQRAPLGKWTGIAETGLLVSSAGQVETVCWFVMSGVLERYPDLKIVMTEGSAGWLSWVMDYLDYAHLGRFHQITEMQMGAPVARLKEKPSDYLRRQLSCTFMWDRAAVESRSFTGLDSLIWANDYPHWEGVYPASQDRVTRQFAGVPEQEIHQMTYGNSARIFGLSG